MKEWSIYFLCLCSAWLTGCSWVNDDLDNCPTGRWMQLSYKYNMLNVEAISSQLSSASIIIIDAQGKYVGKEDFDDLSLKQNNYCVPLPELNPGDYDILVWGGIDNADFTYTNGTVSQTVTEEGEQSGMLSSLFYGRGNHVSVHGEYQIIEVPLVKDTKLISSTIQLASGGQLDADDFLLEINGYNQQIDEHNQPSGQVTYHPFVHQSAEMGSLQVVQSGLSTLRFMKDDQTRLKITYRPTGSQLLTIPLTDYLILSGLTDVRNMDEQEYLDREDHFNLIFFLQETPNPESPYKIVLLQIRDWVLRFDDIVLE